MASPAAPCVVLGAGSWGTALALLLAETGQTVHLWDRTPALINALRLDNENTRYLPGFPLSSLLSPTSDLASALTGALCLVVAVPSGAVRPVLAQAALLLPPSVCDIVLAAKGLEAETGLLPYEVAQEVLGRKGRTPDLFSLVALSGPNLAGEIARGVPAAAVAACPDTDAAHRVAERFTRPAFRVYISSDRTGVELGGAIKNVLAIAGGVSDGLGYGDNTKAALLTRGLAEMTRLGVACGARAETFSGLAGVGDLMATASSRLSRNWRVGEGLARGETLETILARLGQVAEGVPTARAVVRLSSERGVEMPVCTAVHSLLFEGASPQKVVAELMTRSRRDGWSEA